MPVHNFLRFFALTLSLSFVLLVPDRVLAYVGPGAGLELVPYFMGLLAWVAVAFGTILLWPVYALLRRFRSKNDLPDQLKNEPTTVNGSESPGQGSHDNA